MELTTEQEKKLNSIARRIQKASNEIREMGFDVYLCGGSAHVMNGVTHDENQLQTQENVVYEFTIRGWDAGDW